MSGIRAVVRFLPPESPAREYHRAVGDGVFASTQEGGHSRFPSRWEGLT